MDEVQQHNGHILGALIIGRSGTGGKVRYDFSRGVQEEAQVYNQNIGDMERIPLAEQ